MAKNQKQKSEKPNKLPRIYCGSALDFQKEAESLADSRIPDEQRICVVWELIYHPIYNKFELCHESKKFGELVYTISVTKGKYVDIFIKNIGLNGRFDGDLQYKLLAIGLENPKEDFFGICLTILFAAATINFKILHIPTMKKYIDGLKPEPVITSSSETKKRKSKYSDVAKIDGTKKIIYISAVNEEVKKDVERGKKMAKEKEYRNISWEKRGFWRKSKTGKLSYVKPTTCHRSEKLVNSDEFIKTTPLVDMTKEH